MNKLAAAMTGTADMCSFVPHEQWNTVESSHYWLEGEKPICVLKSVNQEFAFTDRAIYFLVTHDIASKRRHIHRTLYLGRTFSDVHMSTADAVHLEIELEFLLGSINFKIHVTKKEQQILIQLFRGLQDVAEQQQRSSYALSQLSHAALTAATALSGRSAGAAASTGTVPPGAIDAAASESFNWLVTRQAANQSDVNVGATLIRYLGGNARHGGA